MARNNNEINAAVLSEITELNRQLATITGQLNARKDILSLTDDKAALQEQISQLKIDRSKLTEEHEREIRETKHFVGLEKNRQKVEMEQATREAKLDVREANLDADKKRFDEQMEFMESRFDARLQDFKELQVELLKRLPTVTVEKSESTERTRKA